MQIKILCLAIVLHLSFGVYASVVLNRELAAIEERGEPLFFAETTPPEIPRGENAAPLYLRAGDMADITSAESYLLPSGRTALAVPNTETVAVLRKYSGAVRLVRRAAFMEKCQFDVDRSDPALTKFPHLAVMRSLARLMVAQALVEAQGGDSRGALRDIEVVFRMTYHLRDEPMLIGFQSTQAMEKMADLALYLTLETTPVSSLQAKQFLNSMPVIDWPAMMKRTLINERTVGIRAFEMARERDPLLVTALEDRSVALLVGSPLQLLWTPWLMLDEVYDLRTYNLGINAVPDFLTVPFKIPPANDEIHAETIPAYAIVTQRIGMTVPRARFKLYTRETWRRQRIVALALAAYKARTGAYPVKLSGLKTPANTPLPLDPFSGKEFKYKGQAKSFILYSVGKNLVDDKGEGLYLSWRNTQGRDDIVWGVSLEEVHVLQSGPASHPFGGKFPGKPPGGPGPPGH